MRYIVYTHNSLHYIYIYNTNHLGFPQNSQVYHQHTHTHTHECARARACMRFKCDSCQSNQRTCIRVCSMLSVYIPRIPLHTHARMGVRARA